MKRNKKIIARKFSRSETWEEGSDFYPWFELNHLGQSICLNEYATQIASGKHTHIIHLDDKNPENGDILEYHVDPNDVQEIMLVDRTWGRRQNYFIPECALDKMLLIAETRKENSQVFVFPSNLIQAELGLHTWKNVQRQEVHNIILDRRTEIDKANVRLNKHVHTFRKTECNVWQDRPNLRNTREVIPTNWHPSVHYLEECNQIIHIVGDRKDEKLINFVFSDAKTNIEE